ncbi:preprotein translocase subunit SecG [Aerococcus urinaehominis]|uniref:Protein-export membrane protein SecG n=1 Tax=Aerococcus urinaehominis TaxID=128944 RepID=A0A0X8FK43_9LACT|nr:preprotein translocase subunit SecG [Aerococcus urinaehominis]AMB98788.1 preprotein translocase subunit SecG [Aerococcus urinaehominis]SDM12631.1 preprotein translocase subunit SecG [Aerococcus urinaehominis]
MDLYNILLITLIVIAVLLILVVAIQSSKNNSASNLTGGSEALFGGSNSRKNRGLDGALDRMTAILGATFMVLALILAKLSA